MAALATAFVAWAVVRSGGPMTAALLAQDALTRTPMGEAAVFYVLGALAVLGAVGL
mgnify:CR=1 FL=1